MKEKLIIVVFALLSINAMSQIKVLTNGKVGFGTNLPTNGRIEIGTDGTADGLGFYSSSTGGSSFRIYRKGDFGFITRGGSDTRGIRLHNTGKSYLYTSDYGDYSSTFITISNNDLQKHYVVQKNENHVFAVYGDGRAWSSGGYYIRSDKREKENIEEIPNALDKVSQIRGVTFNYKNEGQINVTDTTIGEEPYNDNKELTKEEKEALKYNKDKKRAGVIAQEIEKVLPEAVRMEPDGTLSVSYDEIIALLIEALKEQQGQIDELKSSSKKNANLNNTGETGINNENEKSILETEAVLYQNTPNPFTETTKIKYFIPKEAINSTINIYTLNGNPVKTITISGVGYGSVDLLSSELQAGMYVYALIVNNNLIDTKRMVLTE